MSAGGQPLKARYITARTAMLTRGIAGGDDREAHKALRRPGRLIQDARREREVPGR